MAFDIKRTETQHSSTATCKMRTVQAVLAKKITQYHAAVRLTLYSLSLLVRLLTRQMFAQNTLRFVLLSKAHTGSK